MSGNPGASRTLAAQDTGAPTWSLRAVRGWHAVEDGLAIAALAVMALLPFVDILSVQIFDRGIAGTPRFVQHLTLWVAMIGAMVAARQRRHLALATGELLPAWLRRWASLLAAAVATAVAGTLAWTTIDVVRAYAQATTDLGLGIPVWVAVLIIPLGFAVVAVRMWWQAGIVPAPEGQAEGQTGLGGRAGQAWARRAVVLAVLAGVWALSYLPEPAAAAWRWPLVVTVLVATIAGAPIFVLLGGLAIVLFFSNPATGSVAVIGEKTYSLVASDTFPTIPLFTLAGTLLAEGGTPARLVRLFRAMAGWLPGGTAVAAVLVCAFFTTFTGASGVTILALGALLLPVLLEDVYRERFSLGAVTASGSIGLLFPPSLPIILYGIKAQIPINELFVACLLPGCVLVALVSLFCMQEGIRQGARLGRPDPGELGRALWEAKWEAALPVVVFVSLFGGFATTVEAAALTAVYAFIVKCLVHRDVRVRRDLPRVLVESVVLVGGVLTILSCALGFTHYLIMDHVPARGSTYVASVVSSPWVFLLILNFFLIIVGCLMDIFSAIFVVLPLVMPIANTFGIDPYHLGAVFLINLELGYLTPPVGMNLFLSSYRFKKSMFEVTRAVLPFMFVQAASLLIVTYLPALSAGFVHWFYGAQ